MATSAHSTIATSGARPKRRHSTKPRSRISIREATRLLALRDRLEQHLEAMISFLDELDGDADDEPSLAAPEYHPGIYGQGSQELWAQCNLNELEGEHDGCEPQGDEEPSLGWTIEGAVHPDIMSDEAEPSLGAPEAGSGSQLEWAKGESHDREEDCEDEGAQCDGGGGDEAYDNGCADADGADEQWGGFGYVQGFDGSGYEVGAAMVRRVCQRTEENRAPLPGRISG